MYMGTLIGTFKKREVSNRDTYERQNSVRDPDVWGNSDRNSNARGAMMDGF